MASWNWDFLGDKFTWKGKQVGGLVLERLDCSVANNLWFSLNPAIKVQHLCSNSSDHKPIITKPEGISPEVNKCFKFE